ncbi:zinc ribbon domain-containing protein [Parasphingopyxis sp.]|uniref:Zn-ribbon domain-containing OB-fold protein n=1 Tax=Parasphingopyxis sp. TaxID=1920299 RepID=UPI00261E28E8|nr:zinc ribbon domain-containing protein [Parasphingopyxis sp.]
MPEFFERKQLFTDDGGQLLGSQCKQCGVRQFPPTAICRYCGHDELDEIVLAKTGKVKAFSFDRQFAIGDVELLDGITVFGRIEPLDPERLAVGVPVTLTPLETEDGRIIRFVMDD